MTPFNRKVTMNIISVSRLPRRWQRAFWWTLPLWAFAGVFLVSCQKGGPNAKPANVDYYTCTMHPSVRKQSPTDKCPICSMDLTPVKKKGESAAATHAEHAGHTTGAVP